MRQYDPQFQLSSIISIEAAELMELFQWLTPEEALIKSQTDESFREKIGDEVSDVLLYVTVFGKCNRS